MRTVDTVALAAFGIWLGGHAAMAPAQQASPSPTYDCGWVAAAAPIRCEPREDALAGLLRASEAYRAASHFRPDEATWREVLAALRRADAELDPDRLPVRERVVAQNAALRVARTVAGYGAPHDFGLMGDLLRESSRLVAVLAFEPDEIATADEDAEMARWLGPRATWVEERLPDDPRPFHEMVYFHTRAFRMVRVGDRHFIFSQLVAIDRSWQPRVTSVIGDIEMRRDGGRRACIAEFDAAWSRCGAPAGLRALDRLPISHLGGYVEVDAEGRANCLMCHGGDRALGRVLLALPADEVATELARRRGRLLADLAEQLAPIRAGAAEPQPSP